VLFVASLAALIANSVRWQDPGHDGGPCHTWPARPAASTRLAGSGDGEEQQFGGEASVNSPKQRQKVRFGSFADILRYESHVRFQADIREREWHVR
jgi:hypothetical protein